MKVTHLGSVLLTAGLLWGCGSERFQTTFYLDRGVFEESRDGRDPGVKTTDAIIRSRNFWTRYVAPRLTMPIQMQDRVQSSLNLSLGLGSDGVLSEVSLSVCCAPRVELAIVADAVIDGLALHAEKTTNKKGLLHVRHSKKAF